MTKTQRKYIYHTRRKRPDSSVGPMPIKPSLVSMGSITIRLNQTMIKGCGDLTKISKIDLMFSDLNLLTTKIPTFHLSPPLSRSFPCSVDLLPLARATPPSLSLSRMQLCRLSHAPCDSGREVTLHLERKGFCSI